MCPNTYESDCSSSSSNHHCSFFRFVMAYLFVPILQKELDDFKETVWNSHRIRKQKDTCLPDGVPNNIYQLPEEYGLKDCCKNFLELYVLLHFKYLPFLNRNCKMLSW